MCDGKIKRIGVMCSGGDAPGMNAAIRAVVRSAISKGYEIYGIQRGWAGLLEGNIKPMTASSVGNTLQYGGTILQTSRCKEFHEPEIRKEAANILKRKKIDAIVCIGGNGSFNGAYQLYQEHNIPIVGIPATIDNDISGTDYTIGFATAVQTAVEAVDKIRDTAQSHERTFIVEVMGRKSPAIALHVGVCCGAENIVFPTKDDVVDFNQIAFDIKRGIDRGKIASIIIVAEGEVAGNSYRIQKELEEKHDLKSQLCILGHIQRGGCPTVTDRFRASRMGYEAIKAISEGKLCHVTGWIKGDIEMVPLSECLSTKHEYEKPFLDLVHTLAI